MFSFHEFILLACNEGKTLTSKSERRAIMTLSLYSTWRYWRREVAAERAASADGGESPVGDAIAQLGLGLAGIACGGDAPVSRAK
jgi:hypothetical protein